MCTPPLPHVFCRSTPSLRRISPVGDRLDYGLPSGIIHGVLFSFVFSFGTFPSGDGAPVGCGRSARATWPTPPAIWTGPSVLWTVSVPCKPPWKNRRRTWMGGWRPSSRPQATLPSYLDDDGRPVVCLGAPGPLADLVHEGGNDFAWWFVAVCPDHLEGPPNAEQRAIARGRLDDPIGKQEEEITGFQADRGAAGKNAGGVHAQRKARTSEDQLHLAAPVEDVARQVSGAAVDHGAREGMEPAEEEGDKVIRSEILGEALIDAVQNFP